MSEKPRPTFTMQELVAALDLRPTMEDADDVITVHDLVEESGCSEWTVRKRLKAAVEAGLVVEGEAIRWTGTPRRRYRCPAYRVVGSMDELRELFARK